MTSKTYTFECNQCDIEDCPCDVARSVAIVFRQVAEEHGQTTQELFDAVKQVLEQAEDIE